MHIHLYTFRYMHIRTYMNHLLHIKGPHSPQRIGHDVRAIQSFSLPFISSFIARSSRGPLKTAPIEERHDPAYLRQLPAPSAAASTRTWENAQHTHAACPWGSCKACRTVHCRSNRCHPLAGQRRGQQGKCVSGATNHQPTAGP